jgi:hypothetical protein
MSNYDQSPVASEHANVRIVPAAEPEFFAATLEDRLRGDEEFLKQTSGKMEQRRSEADQIHHAHDEQERLAALESNRRKTEQHTQLRSERKQKLLADIDALREAEAQQRQRIEEANAAPTRRRSAEENRNDADSEVAGPDAEEVKMQLAQLEFLQAAAESEAGLRAAEKKRLHTEIQTLRQVASEQIDRMEQSKARLAILEELRVHAETKVCERAEREIRLEAEIEALRLVEASQDQCIEAAEAELRRLTEGQNRAQAAAEAHRNTQKEALRRAAAEAARQAADETRRLTEEKDRELEHLETIRAKAEDAAEERSQKESLLNSQLLAFGEAAAEQLKRIETAEVDLRRAEEELLRLKEEARQKAEQLAGRLAETEARHQSTAQALANAETKAQAILKEDEERLTGLEAIRSQVEADAEKRAEVERQLNAEIQALRAAEAGQLQRIEEAQAEAQRMLEEETYLLRTAQDEAQRINKLKSVRREIEANSKLRQEEEQRLLAEIEALKQVEAEQLNRIANAEVALQARTEELQAAANSVSQEEVEPQSQPSVAPAAESESWASDLRSADPCANPATLWSLAEPCDQTNENIAADSESVGDETVESALRDNEGLSHESSTLDPAEANDDSVSPENPVNAPVRESLFLSSLADRLSSGSPGEYANAKEYIVGLDDNAAFGLITALFDDASQEVRNGAARLLYDRSTARAEIFTQALREASPERRQHIVTAMEASGLANEALDSLAGESREKTHEAFSMLFLMAKAGEVQSLFQAIEKHPNVHVRLSVIKLLTFTNRPDIISPLRSLAVRGALPIEVRSALMNAIYEMSSGSRERSLSAA